MKAKRKWTQDQELFLVMNYPEKGGKYCADIFGIPQSFVKTKAKRMGLKRTPGYRITDIQKSFILENIDSLSTTEIAQKLNISLLKIHTFCKKQNIKLADYDIYTDEEMNFIKNNYLTMSYKEIAEVIGRKMWAVRDKARRMGLKRTPEASQLLQARICYRFEKGHKPIGTMFDGAISIRTDKRGIKYQFIRLAENVWIHLQLYNWEKLNGKIPDDKILRCKTEDTLNADPSNWELTDRADHLARNSGRKDLDDKYISSILATSDKDLRKKYRQMPELIELKRNQLKLRRTINELDETTKIDR